MLKPEWNGKTGFLAFEIRPGTPIIQGRAASQGPSLPGGQPQKFILDGRVNLVEP